MKSNIKVVQSFLNALEQLLEASFTFQDALEKLRPVFNKAKVKEQVEIRNSIAYLIGSKYGVVPKLLTQGKFAGYMGFDANASSAEANASKALRRAFPITVDIVSTPSKQTKKPDPIKAKAKAIKSWGLTKAQALKAVELAYAK